MATKHPENNNNEDQGAINDLIQAITAQSSLLKLNSQIEMARAGEADQNFSKLVTKVGDLAYHADQTSVEAADPERIERSTREALEVLGGITQALPRYVGDA